MSGVKIYVEGGGKTDELRSRCREGFHRLLTKSGFAGRLPKIVACGSRNEAFDKFQTALKAGEPMFVALLVDSEDPVADPEKTWAHLESRDGWERPAKADDTQVFMMTTCMETWIIADRTALNSLYKSGFQHSALPAPTNLESRHRHDVLDALERATRGCTNAYTKNKRSFEALAAVDPAALRTLLPSFERMIRILEEKL